MSVTAWDAGAWLRKFRNVSQLGQGFRECRREVFQTTVAIVREGGYDSGGNTVVINTQALDSSWRGTQMYSHTDEIPVPKSRRLRFNSQVLVTGADCLEVARTLGATGLEPAVLNMACRRNPGGGVLGGSGAQEENLFRRSTLFHSLYQFATYRYHAEYDVPRNPQGQCYPLGRESGAVYSPSVTVFRSSEATGYALLAEPFEVAIVTVPAIPNPSVQERNGRLWLTEPMATGTCRKIRAILRVAAHHRHDTMVLGAFGCGAFRNPPHHMAQLFRSVFAEPEFNGVFRLLVFAILGDHNVYRRHNPMGNLQPFQEVFGV